MAKQCEDCGRSNFDSAVRCAECGSLFLDMIGMLEPDESGRDTEVEPSALPGLADTSVETGEKGAAQLEAPALGVATESKYVRCGDCKFEMDAGPLRCQRCGSRRLETIGRLKGARTALNKRPFRRVGAASIDGEFPSIGLGEVLAFAILAGVKLLFEIPLGVAILFSAVGPGGVSPTTFLWRYPLGIVLITSAAAGAVGSYGLFYLERFGPILLCISFALAAVLLTWVVVNMLQGVYLFWPGTGPYFFLLLVCAVISILAGRLASGNRLGST